MQGKQNVSSGGEGTMLERHMGEPLVWSFNDAVLNSIARQVRIRFEIELCQNAGTIGADRFDAEGELIGDVSNCAPCGGQTRKGEAVVRCRRVDTRVPREVQPLWA